MNIDVFLKGRLVPAGEEHYVVNSALGDLFYKSFTKTSTETSQTIQSFSKIFNILIIIFLVGFLYGIFWQTKTFVLSYLWTYLCLFILLGLYRVALEETSSNNEKIRHWSEYHQILVKIGAINEDDIK
jgi:hypothetical protein